MTQEPLFPAEAPNQPAHGRGWSAEGLFRLLAQQGIGPRRAIALASSFADWGEMASARPAELQSVAGTPAARLAGMPEPTVGLTHGGACVVGWFDRDFPAALRHLPDAPALLWVRGILPRDVGVAVVGSRAATAMGAQFAAAVARQAVDQGLTVVSGLALGIDSWAHRGCLEAGGCTIAVLGSGIDVVSPLENRWLADEIVGAGGAVISEVAPGTRPSARTLVPRNRLQTALSRAVVVVQCGIPSGTLSTVRFAVQQGRAVAVVAPPSDPRADVDYAGNRALIHAEGCDPRILGASGDLAERIRKRRPFADLVMHSPEDLADIPGLAER